MKKALITGITGQDGSYLAELLLEKEYEVHGIVRRQATGKHNLVNINHILDKITLHEGDLLDEICISNIIRVVMPDEVYNLAAQSHVRVSSDMPIYTSKVNGISVVTLLEAIKLIKPECKFYQASTSEMFGNSVNDDGFQTEDTPMYPVSPYGCAKLFAHNICKHYREAYNMFICTGILFNHESPRRGLEFVTQKIVQGAVEIVQKKKSKLELGNLDAHRDWSHAKDMVRGMWLMMQQEKPDNFILASGETHSVREFCDIVFKLCGMNYEDHIEINPKFFRPQELNILKGKSDKAKNILNWKIEYSFNDLIMDMYMCVINSDCAYVG